MLGAERHGAVEQRLLDRRQQLLDVRGQALHRHERLLARVAARQHHLRLLDVLGPDLEAQRHAAQLPLVELPAGRLRVAVVEHHADAARDQRRRISCAFGSTVSFQLPRGIGTITTW